MRLLHALAHLVLAVAMLTAGMAQARAIVGSSGAMVHHRYGASATPATDHASHQHGRSCDEEPVHSRDACQTACCFTPGEFAARMAEASPVEFRPVRYPGVSAAMSSLTPTPEPGIPKRAA